VLAIDIMFQRESSHDIAGYASTLHFLSTVTLSDPGEIRYSVGFYSVMFVLLGVDAQVPPALKRVIGSRVVHGALKRSFPRINAGAPTKWTSLTLVC
jgi:hypothetical protein